jgi:hypothetical protein
VCIRVGGVGRGERGGRGGGERGGEGRMSPQREERCLRMKVASHAA